MNRSPEITKQFYLNESFSIPQIEALLNDSLLSGGKRMRPLFTRLMGALFGLDFAQIKNCAIASELVHAAFLAHDDVIDEAKVRRGVRTINARTDNKRAVLAGDALLARVCEIVMQEPSRELMKDLAWTIRQTVEGEWLQMESIGLAPLSLAQIEDVGFRKTGALLVWCARSAAHLAEQDQVALDLCSDLGRLLGVAFQLTDDVIDFSPSAGKAFAKDYNEGLVNAVTSLMMQRDPHLIEDFMQRKSPVLVGEEPWSANLLAEAMAEVRGRAQVKLSLAESCVEKIFLRNASPSGAQRDARDQLQALIRSVQGRKV